MHKLLLFVVLISVGILMNTESTGTSAMMFCGTGRAPGSGQKTYAWIDAINGKDWVNINISGLGFSTWRYRGSSGDLSGNIGPSWGYLDDGKVIDIKFRCADSNGQTIRFIKFTIIVNTPSPTPTPPVTATPTPFACNCTEWVDSVCGGIGDAVTCPSVWRLQTRHCQSQIEDDCRPEERCVNDFTCRNGGTPEPTPSLTPTPTPGPDDQSQYQIQVVNHLTDVVVYDSGTLEDEDGDISSFVIPNDGLRFDPTGTVQYRVRVQVWDSGGDGGSVMPSGWQDMEICEGNQCDASGTYWDAPKHKYPDTNFTIAPPNPAINQDIQFTDTSICYDSDGLCNTWSWAFGDGASSSLQNPTHAYTQESAFIVRLHTRDEDDYICPAESGAAVISVQRQVPEWREVLPQ